jgi:nitric oxide reductase large subunit
MRYKSQKVAYWFFALSMLLLTLQLVYGFIMGFAHMGYDGLHSFIPFNTARAVHTNLLVVWLLSGFMGAAYYIIPEEAEYELVNVKLALHTAYFTRSSRGHCHYRLSLQLLGRTQSFSKFPRPLRLSGGN